MLSKRSDTMRIGELAKQSGVGVETVRFYEQKGLVAQPQRPVTGGYRDYPHDAVQRIRFIRRAQQIGFSLSEIGELLSLRANPEADCADVRERAAAKLADVNQKIASLKRMRKALQELIAACPASGALRACSILDALEN